ncbi:hypothetical protein PEDI_35490 [Persicobacter diffluens]|uniref:Uncharacterized protein n=1 Tax=Persicobacter diffluens TaxID=981 RepID=A0AAN5ALN4_9BACT|nr:hypothetical protein PEDI_35490 [Persicobacter diffluens]
MLLYWFYISSAENLLSVNELVLVGVGITFLILLIVKSKQVVLLDLKILDTTLKLTTYSLIAGRRTFSIQVEDVVNVYYVGANEVELWYKQVMGNSLKGKPWKAIVKKRFRVYAEPWGDINFQFRQFALFLAQQK